MLQLLGEANATLSIWNETNNSLRLLNQDVLAKVSEPEPAGGGIGAGAGQVIHQARTNSRLREENRILGHLRAHRMIFVGQARRRIKFEGAGSPRQSKTRRLRQE